MLPTRLFATVSPRVSLAGLLLLTGCSSDPAGTPASAARVAEVPPAAAAPAAPITLAQVEHATIGGVFEAPFTLAQGTYEGPPFDPAGSARPMAILMTPLVRFGELDDQPGADAAALLASNSGGSGEHITISVVSVRDGMVRSIGTADVGNRTKVRDLRVSGRDVVIDVVQIGPGEAACCGTQLATRTFRLVGDVLTEVASEVTGRLSLASTVGGFTWTLAALDGEPPAAGSPALTLMFADGRLSGSTGCNQYRAPVDEPEPGTLKVGPPISTRRACVGEGAALEPHFLKALGGVTGYTFLSGRLVLSGLDGEQMRSLSFDRRPSTEHP